IESAIRLVWNNFDAGKKWTHTDVVSEKDACYFIAKCYLLRSRLTLPKGADIPAKKLEALDKAWEWAEKGSEETDALKMGIVLERKQWDSELKEEWIESCMVCFLNPRHYKFRIKNSLHWAINDMARESGMLDDDSDRAIADYDIKSHNKFLPFYQARAALRLNANDISGKLENAVECLRRIPLSHPLWKNTSELIRNVSEKDEYKGQWEDAAILAWKICQKAEEDICLSIQVRWYWGGYSGLYDLAFQAAISKGELPTAVRIADSLKSRPTIKMQNAERCLGDDDAEIFKKLAEIEALSLADTYIPHVEAVKKEFKTKVRKDKSDDKHESRKDRDILDVPKGWAAVHFYITGKKEGHALIVENGNAPRHVLLDISEVWNAFCEWDEARRRVGIGEDSKGELEMLCDEAGEMLTSVLEEISAENILFIPHGFLHLVPLHASYINDDETCLFEEKTCLFLPSWSLAPSRDESDTPTRHDDILLTNWDCCDDIREIITQDGWKNKEIINSTANDVFDAIETSPRLLVLFSHGQGDSVNPYQAKFLMNGPPLTHQELIGKLPELHGTRVILTACESDLVSGNFELTDEHLSLATAFLRRRANEVIGALFSCYPSVSQELILSAKDKPKKPLYQILQNKQTGWKKSKDVYKVPAFRVMGFPAND
ncbi:MAG: hypothetical protein DRI57_30820, partial [Deltaproteobacteria bacterium]